MKRICLFCILGIFLTACTSVRDYPVIKDPGYPRIVVKKKEGKVIIKKEKVLLAKKKQALVKEERVLVGTFYPDPTRILIGNQTYNIFVEVWLTPSFKKGKVKGPPDFDLPPNAKIEAIMPLGKHQIYAKGRIKTREYGWQSVGVVNKEVSISSRVYYGGYYGDYVIFHQSDFPR